jgi:hypothetical protein
MVKKSAFIILLLISFGWARAQSQDALRPGDFKFGGRFEYQLLLDEQSYPYPWNATTQAAVDRTRLMLDLKALETRYGSLYLKGAGYWGFVSNDDVEKRFRFEQGDYLWERNLEKWNYGISMFASERRFFVYDFTAPLIDDDRAGESGGNRGARVDIKTQSGFDITGLYSLQGDDPGRSRSIAYLKGLYWHRLASFSASYLFDNPGVHGPQNHAVIKTELSSVWKLAFASISYQQSGYEDSGLFFPSGSFDWGAYDGTNFSQVLPSGGAAFAEFRFRSIRVTDAGRLNFVWKYDAVRENFVSDLGMTGGSRVGQTAAAYFLATDVSASGRLLYHKSVRSVLESEERDLLEASARTALRNGMELFLRGGVGQIDEQPFDTKKNYIHGMVRYGIKNLDTGAHIMWNDLGTIYSERRFAWDGKMVLTPDWGLHWRFLLTRDFTIGQSTFFRLEYRPSNRIFAYLGYGRTYFGDDRFVLEDRDLAVLRSGSSQWVITLRGDF